MKPRTLLHTLVAIGAGLTGGIDAFGCGGATDAAATRDATADSGQDSRYGRIAVDSSYGTIMPAPRDASTTEADAFDASDDGGDAG